MVTNETGGPKGVQVWPTLKSAGDLMCLIKIERFSYDLEMKTREQNGNNKQMEIV